MLTINDDAQAAALAQAQNHPLWERQVELERGMLLDREAQLRESYADAPRRRSLGGSDALRERLRPLHPLPNPIYKPSVIPPRPWTAQTPGGYWTAYAANPYFTSGLASPGQLSAVVADAANYLQNIPWRVNRRLLDVAAEAWRRDLAIADLPSQASLRPQDLSHDAGGDPHAVLDWYRHAVHLAADEYSRQSAIRVAVPVMAEAQRYVGFERFYFPQALRLAGLRPLSRDFEPCGSDLARALIEFADGQVITEGHPGGNGGDGWLALQLSACFGVEAPDHDTRIAWVFKKEEQFRQMAADPLANLEWTDAKCPWCALAAIFDFVAFLDTGYGYVSHLPVSTEARAIWERGAKLRPEAVSTAVRAAQEANIAFVGFESAPCVTHAADAWRVLGILDDVRTASEWADRARVVMGGLQYLRKARPDDPRLAEFDQWERRSRGEFDASYPIGSAPAPL